jgi:hypothetical protein
VIRARHLAGIFLFFLVFTAAFSRPSSAQFETRGSFTAADFPNSIAVGDFNHDGKLDLAVAPTNSIPGFGTEVLVLLGNGDGTFQPAVHYAVGTVPNSVAVADFNNDGNLDLAVSNGQSDSVSVLLGNGDGTFQPATTFATRQDPILVMVGDFNGDGKLDIATLNLSDNTGRCDCVAIFLGNGDGTFQEPPIITTPSLPAFGLGVGRFTAGKNLDLAVSEEFGTTNQVEILLGKGDGTFQPGAIYPVGAGPNAIAVADFNGDHNLDLAVAESEEDAIGVLLGNGDGTFQSQVLYGAYAPLWVTAADLNGDNKQDLVVADIAANSLTNTGVSVLTGNGDGTFQRSVYYRGGNANRFVAVGDFNGDRKPDIVYAASGSTYVTVLLNTGVVAFKPTTPLNFKKQKAGTTSAPRTVTLTNTGKTALSISSMKATGQFGMTSTCGSSVAAGANCAISVTFSPKTPGAKSGTVSIRDSASTKPQVIELSGTGT